MAKSNRKTRAEGIESAAEAVGGGTEARQAVLFGRQFYKAVGLLFLLALLFRFFDPIAQVLLIAFLAGIIGIAYNAVVVRLPLNRPASMAILGVGTLAAIGLGFWFVVTFVADQLRQFVADLPAIATIVEDAEAWIHETTGIEIELLVEDVAQVARDLFQEAGGFALIGGALGFVEVIAMALLVLMGAFFIVAKPNEQFLMPLMRAVPPDRRDAYHRMFSLLGKRLSGWLIGTLASMLVVGVLSTIAFVIIGLPYAILLGVLNGLLGIIPLIGAWIGGIVAILVALFAAPGSVIWVILAVIAIQELEGNLIRPMVMSGSAQVHPFVTLLALLLFTSMFGVLGAILSLPIALALITVVEVLWVEETLGTQDDEIEPVVEE